MTKDTRKPDYLNSLYFTNEQGKSKRMDLPPSWVNDSGRIITETPMGRLVQTPREMLDQMRNEKKAPAPHEQEHEDLETQEL